VGRAGSQLERTEAPLQGLERHPHARAVLGAALGPEGSPSHAYLFHGPPGSGKRAAAGAFAAALLAEGAEDPAGVRERVARGTHPDLTWVTPSGASEMLVSDVDEAVVAAAARTPFEARRRVFVLEHAEALNDQAANRMLKTLEEPLAFVHLVLLTERPEDVLPTIASRCQHVRFDRAPSPLIAAGLTDTGTEARRALACARLSEGDAGLARMLAGEEGSALRAGAEGLVGSALSDQLAGRPWLGLLEAAREQAARVGEEAQERAAEQLELVPARERKRLEREAAEARRRAERRARTSVIDLGLRLVELWLRDMLCVLEGAPDLVLAVDRTEALETAAAGTEPFALRRALALVGDTRLALSLNVSEELALDALFYRLAETLA
jgi:DNA polymerase-3 subunit delta'